MERFFLNLKMERVWQKDYANHFEASNDIADYIVGFYNAIRLHSKLGNMSPNAFERGSTSEKSIELSEITWPPRTFVTAATNHLIGWLKPVILSVEHSSIILNFAKISTVKNLPECPNGANFAFGMEALNA